MVSPSRNIHALELVQHAEALGFDSVFTAEAYGSDATSPLAYLAALTQRIRLGTSIMQLAGRTPAMAAMQAATIDALAGGNRFIAGLGVSGPQIVEGWYGEPWGRPYYRIRDYVSIMRKIFERKEPVSHDGREISLPFKGEGAMGIGKPLRSILHMNPKIPIWLGTGTEANVRLTAEIADGWFPLSFAPGMMSTYRPWLEEGFARAGGGKSFDDFEIQPGVSVAVTDDVRGALARMKPNIALYVGGMGQRAHGAAEFEVGERVIVFLTTWDDGTPKVLGYVQGKSRNLSGVKRIENGRLVNQGGTGCVDNKHIGLESV